MTTSVEHRPFVEEPRLRDIPLTWGNFARLPALALIRLYQMTLSRALPSNTCRFSPTCSHYGYQAIARHGLLKGGMLGAWRVLRCQPLSRGGYDPVPQ
ncbi:MAG TPA: membrane protein insertion efficiency factor YidD [Anaerolineales bacterium]|nr:membrane protein insertion efficiency factor YidD [Anaerolineales bacterium]